jgi:hypothetical protein
VWGENSDLWLRSCRLGACASHAVVAAAGSSTWMLHVDVAGAVGHALLAMKDSE